MPTMTITDKDWTIEEMAEAWADDNTLTPEQCRTAADTEAAWIINNISKEMPGWSYDATTGTFSGPAAVGGQIANPVGTILGLICEAVDFTIEHLDEIRAEA